MNGSSDQGGPEASLPDTVQLQTLTGKLKMAGNRSIGLPVSLLLSGLLKYHKGLYFKMLPTVTPDRAPPVSTLVIYILEQLPFR